MADADDALSASSPDSPASCLYRDAVARLSGEDVSLEYLDQEFGLPRGPRPEAPSRSSASDNESVVVEAPDKPAGTQGRPGGARDHRRASRSTGRESSASSGGDTVQSPRPESQTADSVYSLALSDPDCDLEVMSTDTDTDFHSVQDMYTRGPTETPRFNWLNNRFHHMPPGVGPERPNR